MSKLCAWRDKDRAWIAAGLGVGVLRIEAMRQRARRISNPNGPEPAEIDRRLAMLGRADGG